jgi:hypothetical protein
VPIGRVCLTSDFHPDERLLEKPSTLTASSS